jgi:hypothetical protein
MALIDELKERREAVAEKLEAAYLSVAHLRADIDDLDAAIDALTPIPAEDTVNAIESLPGFVSWTNDENPELFEASVALEQLETDHALPPSADDVVTDLQGDTVEEMREAFEDVFEAQAEPIPQPEWNEPQPVELVHDVSELLTGPERMVQAAPDSDPQTIAYFISEGQSVEMRSDGSIVPLHQTDGYAPVTNPEADALARAHDYYSPEKVAERERFNPWGGVAHLFGKPKVDA